MPDPAGTYYDGDFETPAQVGPAILWKDEETGAEMARATFQVRRPFFTAGSIGAASTTSTFLPTSTLDTTYFLILESQPTEVGGDVVEYSRTYSKLPPTRSEPLPYVYPFQIISGAELIEIPVPVTATVTYSYEHNTDPTNATTGLEVDTAYKAVSAGGTIYYFGDIPAVDDVILAEDETWTKWNGYIWEKRSITITYLDLAEA